MLELSDVALISNRASPIITSSIMHEKPIPLFFTRLQFRARLLWSGAQSSWICGNIRWGPGRLRHQVRSGGRLRWLGICSSNCRWVRLHPQFENSCKISSIDKNLQYCFSENSETNAGWWKQLRKKGKILIGWGARLATVRKILIFLKQDSCGWFLAVLF